MYIHTYICIRIHESAHTHTHSHTAACAVYVPAALTHTYQTTYIQQHTFNRRICVCVDPCIYSHIYIYIYICLLCIYIYTHIHTTTYVQQSRFNNIRSRQHFFCNPPMKFLMYVCHTHRKTREVAGNFMYVWHTHKKTKETAENFRECCVNDTSQLCLSHTQENKRDSREFSETLDLGLQTLPSNCRQSLDDYLILPVQRLMRK